MEAIGLIAMLVLMPFASVAGLLWSAWWTLPMWNEMVGPALGLPMLGYVQWAVVAMTVNYITRHSYVEPKEKDGTPVTRAIGHLVTSFLGPMVVYGVYRLLLWIAR